MKKAFITGITGQDGSYLSELLLSKDYEVHAIIRRNSVFTTQRIDHLIENPNLKLYHGDLTDSGNLGNLISNIKPDEIYNLAAQSHVAVSYELPEYTSNVDAIGTIRLLDVIKKMKNNPRFYQASTSELFGGFSETAPQSEKTQFHPRSPYAVAKIFSYWATINYREAYGLYACNGILFNHESPRRGETFVTRKITKGVVRIKKGSKEPIKLGNLNAVRDWGYAKDYVEMMWLMLQQESPKDYVIATGKAHTVREFVEYAFQEIDIKIIWEGKGNQEVGKNPKTGAILVAIDPKYYRPAEVEYLCGDPSLAKKELGWYPKTSLKDLVKIMINYDLNNEN